MEPDLLAACRTVDPAVLGPRVRAARLRAGLTQAEAAGSEMSTAYVSRIEAGQRRPDPALLAALAGRLGTSVEQLLTGVTREQEPELRTLLSWVELSLTTGEPERAAEQLVGVDEELAALPDDALVDLRREATWLRARLREVSGDLDGAILLLEDLVSSGATDLRWLEVMTALSRCYRESGDLARAVEVGERAADVLADLELGGSDEAVALTVTVAAAHVERGDVAHAARTCRRAVELAERLESPRARAAAYWNASIIESLRGRPAQALPLAQRALRLLEEGPGGRNLARLRSQLGLLQLRLDPPAPQEAWEQLRTAEEALLATDAGVLDLAANRLGQARAALLLGRASESQRLVEDVLEQVGEEAPLLAAEAHLQLGEVALARGHVAAARTGFQQAVMRLSAVGADRQAAQLWFDLGAQLEQVGQAALALDAYRRAAAATGLRMQRSPAVEVGAGEERVGEAER
ncbi:helix-turn-helix domain-containing protein [Nocardioides sp.]|uniref:helix-turn-helix domain-containing protein n=1 Tax=Nocardioides sp. TaxID=35761 RepID=UPI0026278A06|nr:helix-turn-helix domain-containing protein [Nocardioides sp.]